MHAKSPTFRAAKLKGFTVIIRHRPIAVSNLLFKQEREGPVEQK